MGYFKNILISIDQVGNTIAGGNPDCTISGRVGFLSNHAVLASRWYWVFIEFIIDRTFYPLDGWNHCHDSYHKDEKEKYVAPKGFMVFLLSLITITFCIPMAILFYSLWMFRIIKPKT